MDSEGRLHMPGFVGQTFEETGAKRNPSDNTIADEHGNRRSRRVQAAIDRHERKIAEMLKG